MAKRTPKPSLEEIREQREAALETRRMVLCQQSRENPHQFFTLPDIALILDFGEKAIGRLSGAGAPVVFRKMNPGMVCAWISTHPDEIAKIGMEDENS